MNWTAASRSVLPGLCLLVATGCQDHPMPTEPARTHAGRADAQAVGLSQRPGSTPYLCYTSVATPEGAHPYRYGRMYLHFPGHQQTMAGGGTAGASVRYQFRYISVDGTVKRAANCVIPATEAALRMMNRRFATDESNGVDRLPTGDGGAVLQTVALEQIVVEASGCSNPDWQRDDSGVCWPPTHDPGGADGGDPWGGGGDDPWGGSGGGGIGSGDDPEPPEPDEPEPCDTGHAHIDSPGVSAGFESIWTQSLEQGVEKGGWIVQNGNSYTLVPFQNATFTACGIDIYEAPPADAVSMVHTHPWPLFHMRDCDGQQSMYTGTPSPEDVAALGALGFAVGYFLDHNGIGRYTADGGEQAQRIERCGY